MSRQVSTRLTGAVVMIAGEGNILYVKSHIYVITYAKYDPFPAG